MGMPQGSVTKAFLLAVYLTMDSLLIARAAEVEEDRSVQCKVSKLSDCIYECYITHTIQNLP